MILRSKTKAQSFFLAPLLRKSFKHGAKISLLKNNYAQLLVSYAQEKKGH